MNVLLSLVLVCVSGHMTTASWTSTHRNQILKIHNDHRKGTKGACGMNMMTYDTQLENEAKAWAKGCAFKHQMKGRGENIAYYPKYGNVNESTLVQKMAKMWYDEIRNFQYNANSCGAACHYTQMVWSKTTKLGCYAEQCAQMRGGGRNAYFLVCFYNPAGNMRGEKPYKKDCSGKTNNNNNKVSPGNSNNNNNNNNECKDTTSKCAGWASKGECDRNPNYMKSKCQKSCNACESTGTNNNGWRYINNRWYPAASYGRRNGWPSGNTGWKGWNSGYANGGRRTWGSYGKK